MVLNLFITTDNRVLGQQQVVMRSSESREWSGVCFFKVEILSDFKQEGNEFHYLLQHDKRGSHIGAYALANVKLERRYTLLI